VSVAVVVAAEIVVVVLVVVVVKVVAGIISILVAVGRGGDYLDTSSGSSSRDYFREISCSESVLWTTNCPLVLACDGLGDSGHFLWSLYTFRIQSVFLLSIKYTHDYPHYSAHSPYMYILNRFTPHFLSNEHINSLYSQYTGRFVPRIQKTHTNNFEYLD
jgi:preprotein translocase subunit SecG